MNPATLATMTSSASVEWSTPQDLFDKLNEEFHFTLDVCATAENAKCAQYLSLVIDGLSVDWAEGPRFIVDPVKGIVLRPYRVLSAWMNPPYGKEIGKWVRKAYEESTKGCTVVALLPARTDTKWFQDFVLPYAELRFIRGRLKFGGHKNAAPFPSVIAIFRGAK